MCGICGRVSWHTPPDRSTLLKMANMMKHRGPDASGYFINNNVALGHRRLSIIDLSDSANQPMADQTGRFRIVFNGEIYNYQDIKALLKSHGIIFLTNSDTEVILEAYKYWGTDCLQRFNGMFVFAIWDEKERSLFLARDRLGKKPLFYSTLHDGGIIFASEIKSLIQDPEVSRDISHRGLIQYASINYILGNECILKNVFKLQPGTFMLVKKGKAPSLVKYWDLASCFYDKKYYTKENVAVEEFLALFLDAVKIRMVSDVPLGAFLSGGIDSSAIVWAMQSFSKNSPIKSFSIGFKEKGYDELPYAKMASEAFGTEHKAEVVAENILTELKNIAIAADEPFADTSMIPMYHLARFTRKYVTVSLSGDGGDEIFSGYDTYVADKIHNYLRWVPSIFWNQLSSFVDRFKADYGKVSFNYKLKQFLKGLSLPANAAHFAWRQILNADRIMQIFHPDIIGDQANLGSAYRTFQRFDQDVAGCHYLDRSMYVDIKTWLADDILVKVDRSTMAHSLEARAPFLDYRLVEFCARLAPCLRLKGLIKKYLLKKSMVGRLPYSLIKRKKAGFNSPIAYWLTGDMLNFLKKSDDSFNDAYIDKLVYEHQNMIKDNSLPLLAVINYSLWRKYVLV